MTEINLAAVILISLGGIVVAGNWFGILRYYWNGHYSSAVPLFGALFLSAGMLLRPPTRAYAWLPFLLDYGTLVLVYSLPMLIREFWKISRFNLLEEYEGQEGTRIIRLRLFRGGRFMLEYGPIGIPQSSTGGTWTREQERLVLNMDGDTATFEPLPLNLNEGIIARSSFRKHLKTLSLAEIQLTLRSRKAE